MSTVTRTADYTDRDTSGWTLTSAGASTYDSTRTYRRNSTAVATGYDRIRVRVDIISGDYEVYQDNTWSSDTLIYTYDGETNSTSISNEDLYSEFFTGSTTYTNQANNLSLGTRQDILALAAQNSETDIGRTRLESLESLLGYQSLSNTGLYTTDNEDGTLLASGNINPNSTPTSDDDNDSLSTTNQISLGGARAVESNPGIVYRYPLDIPDLGYDFIKITSYEYIRAGLPRGDRRSAASRLFNLLNRPLERIILPMQPNLSETNAVDWGGDKLNAIQGTLAQGAIGAIRNLSEFNLQGVKDAAGATIDSLKNLAKDDRTKAFIAAYFAGQAVGRNITARATGTVINPNLELLFSGPRLRTFNFNFTFTPRSEEESEEIRKIIKTFKRNMAPQRSTTGLFLKTPRIFKLEYIYNDTDRQHPFLNKFKPCAMTSFAVNYTPDGSYSTYEDGSLTSYAVTMSFGELEPIYADEYDASWRNMGY